MPLHLIVNDIGVTVQPYSATTVTGSGASTQVAVFTGTSTTAGYSGFTYNSGTNVMTVTGKAFVGTTASGTTAQFTVGDGTGLAISKVLGQGTNGPAVLSLFSSGAREGFIAQSENQMYIGNTGGMANFNYATFPANSGITISNVNGVTIGNSSAASGLFVNTNTVDSTTATAGFTYRGGCLHLGDDSFDNRTYTNGITIRFADAGVGNGLMKFATDQLQFGQANSNSAVFDSGSPTFTMTLITGQLRIPTTGSSAGILVGGDALWYRSAADVWRTPDSVIIDTALTVSGATVTLGDACNVVVNATTGTKIGTATTQKLSFHNSTPVVQRAGAAQAAVATTGSTSTTPFGYTTAAQADAIVTLVNEIRATLVEKGLMKGSA